jgi:hypothetical protein
LTRFFAPDPIVAKLSDTSGIVRSSVSTDSTTASVCSRLLPSGRLSQTLNSARSSCSTKSTGTARASAMPPSIATTASDHGRPMPQPRRQRAPVGRFECAVAAF